MVKIVLSFLATVFPILLSAQLNMSIGYSQYFGRFLPKDTEYSFGSFIEKYDGFIRSKIDWKYNPGLRLVMEINTDKALNIEQILLGYGVEVGNIDLLFFTSSRLFENSAHDNINLLGNTRFNFRQIGVTPSVTILGNSFSQIIHFKYGYGGNNQSLVRKEVLYDENLLRTFFFDVDFVHTFEITWEVQKTFFQLERWKFLIDLKVTLRDDWLIYDETYREEVPTEWQVGHTIFSNTLRSRSSHFVQPEISVSLLIKN